MSGRRGCGRATARVADAGARAEPRHARTRSLGDGLHEIRIKAAEGTGRALYCTLIGQRIVILHGFVKKSGKTPAKDLDLARRRMKQVQHRE